MVAVIAAPGNGGPLGNERLTAATAAVLLVLLAAEGVTIVFLGPLLAVHLFLGMLLIPPVLLKLATTGYRFARYYAGSRAYRERGAPHLLLRAMGPLLVLSTLAVFGTGVALLIEGPKPETLILVHKVSFFVWLALMGVHVLAHIQPLPMLARADWWPAPAGGPELTGATARRAVLVAALAAGIGLAAVTASLIGPWLSA